MPMPTVEERIAELERKLAELKAPSTPPPNLDFKRINPLDRLAMPSDAIRAMADAVPDQLLREIVNDNRSRPSSTSLGEPEDRPPLSVAVERELRPPSGVDICDRLVDQQ